MIEYVITENHLPANPTGYAARVLPARIIEFENLVDRVARSNTTVSKSDVLSVLQDFCVTIQELIMDGMNVNTPIANFRPTITGTFTDQSDSFDPARHRVVVRVTSGKSVRRVIRDAQVGKVLGGKPKPMPVTYIDGATGVRNGVITPGRPGRLMGDNLRYDVTDPAQGVFFINSADGTATRVEELVWGQPAHLAFIVPALVAGDYTVQVRAVPSGNHELRIGVMDNVLTVV